MSVNETDRRNQPPANQEEQMARGNRVRPWVAHNAGLPAVQLEPPSLSRAEYALVRIDWTAPEELSTSPAAGRSADERPYFEVQIRVGNADPWGSISQEPWAELGPVADDEACFVRVRIAGENFPWSEETRLGPAE